MRICYTTLLIDQVILGALQLQNLVVFMEWVWLMQSKNFHELHLISLSYFFANNIETIGISCPMLKSFTFCQYVSVYIEYKDHVPTEQTFYNEYGVAIGKTVPNLLHLRVSSHMMQNKGLEAILDGCPHLESLDIRQCSGFDLRGALGKRCSKIKDLRLPSDSISEHEWPIKPSAWYL